MKGKLFSVLGATLTAQVGLAAVINPITAVTPTGTRNGGAAQPTVLTSITAASQTWVSADLISPPSESFVEIIPPTGLNVGRGNGLSAPSDVRTSMVGLQAGYSALGIDNVNEAVRGYFNRTIPVDGWIFVLEWAAGRDNFKIQLLDNAPGGTPNIVATINITGATDYVSTTLIVGPNSSGTNQPIGGVAIKLSELSLSGGITGVQLPGDAPSGGVTGLDPCVIAAALPEPSAALLLAGALPALRRRRRD